MRTAMGTPIVATEPAGTTPSLALSLRARLVASSAGAPFARIAIVAVTAPAMRAIASSRLQNVYILSFVMQRRTGPSYRRF